MSGDVQTRRRRDKRKKKEEQIEETLVHPQQTPAPILANDDVNIHVHKDSSLGGGICAKCVFFIFMIAISVIIGFTIIEHRGQTDVDIPISESRFASIFEGWIDKSIDTHDNEDERDTHVSSEQVSHEDADEVEDELEESEEHSEETSDEDESEIEYEQEEDDSTEEEYDEEDNTDEKEEVESQEEEEEEEEIDRNLESEEDVIAESDENKIIEELDVEDDSTEKWDEMPHEHEPEDELEEDKDRSVEVQDDEDDQSDENSGADVDSELTTAGLAAKFGVGVALLIVAYVVLVKKWKSDKINEDDTVKEEAPDLTRRNTFVPPPTLEEVEQDIENIEEEYLDDEEVEESDDERRNIPTSKRQYEELRTTYHRSLTPDSDSECKKFDYSEEEEEEEDEEDVEETEEEEGEDYDYEDYGGNVEEEESEGEDENEELMKKLEAKYGKLGGRSVQEDDSEHFQSWKRNLKQ